MIIVYNNGVSSVPFREMEKRDYNNMSYVHIGLDNGDFITVLGEGKLLDKLIEVLEHEKIATNLDDFSLLDYYENMSIVDIEIAQRPE